MAQASVLTTVIVLASLGGIVVDRLAYRWLGAGDIVLFDAGLPVSADILQPWMFLSFPFGILCGLFAVGVSRLTMAVRARLLHLENVWMPAVLSGTVTTVLASITYSVTGNFFFPESSTRLHVWGDGRKSLNRLMAKPIECTTNNLIGAGGEPEPCGHTGPQFFAAAFLFTAAKVLAVAFAVAANGPGGMYRSTLVLGGGFGACCGAVFHLLAGTPAEEGHFRLFIPIGMWIGTGSSSRGLW